MNNFQPLPPDDFTNPYETEIIKLEKQLSESAFEGKTSDDLQILRDRIRILKSEIAAQRVGKI